MSRRATFGSLANNSVQKRLSGAFNATLKDGSSRIRDSVASNSKSGSVSRLQKPTKG